MLLFFLQFLIQFDAMLDVVLTIVGEHAPKIYLSYLNDQIKLDVDKTT